MVIKYEKALYEISGFLDCYTYIQDYLQNVIYQILQLYFLTKINHIKKQNMFPEKHHHHGHHHHGHHKDPKVVIVVEKPHHSPAQDLINLGLNQVIKNTNQGFNNNSGFGANQGFNYTGQGFNNMGQGFNNNAINMNQGFNPNPLQLFNPYQEYFIQSGVGHHMVLDVCQKKNNYGKLILYKKTGKQNQRFRIVQQNNRYVIVSCSATNVLTVLNNSSQKGQHIHTHFNSCENGQLWQFSFVKDSPNTFYIHNGHNLYMDVFHNKHSDGTPIIQWKYNGNKNQMWRIVPA